MTKKSRLTKTRKKELLLAFMPLTLEFVLHVAPYMIRVNSFRELGFKLSLAVFLTIISLLFGEGYGAIFFMVNHISKSSGRLGFGVITIVASILSMFASLIGMMITAIEGAHCTWMTCGFWGIDIFMICITIYEIVLETKEKYQKKKDIK